jgi:hypothetical protein
MDNKMKNFGHVLFSWTKMYNFLGMRKCHAQKSINSCARDNGHAQKIGFCCAKNQSMHKKWGLAVHKQSFIIQHS